MSTTVRFVTNRAGIREAALTAASVRQLISARAHAVASAAASSGYPIVVLDAGRSRARSYVIIDSPAGAAIESKHRVLGTAIDAGRG